MAWVFFDSFPPEVRRRKPEKIKAITARKVDIRIRAVITFCANVIRSLKVQSGPSQTIKLKLCAEAVPVRRPNTSKKITEKNINFLIVVLLVSQIPY